MNTKRLTVGLDLGDRRHHACVLDAAGEILAEEGGSDGVRPFSAMTRELRIQFPVRFTM